MRATLVDILTFYSHVPTYGIKNSKIQFISFHANRHPRPIRISNIPIQLSPYYTSVRFSPPPPTPTRSRRQHQISIASPSDDTHNTERTAITTPIRFRGDRQLATALYLHRGRIAPLEYGRQWGREGGARHHRSFVPVWVQTDRTRSSALPEE